jgi:Transposase IS4
MADEDASDDDSEPLQADYDPYTPFITYLEHRDGTVPEYSPVHDGEISQFGPYFRIPGGAEIGVESLMQMFFPDWLLEQMVVCTRAYAESRLTFKKLKEIGKADILRFIAALYYMGVVRMPSKFDYFFTGYVKSDVPDVWPLHSSGVKINKTMFIYLWRNFHMHKKPNTYNFPDEEFPEPPDERHVCEQDSSDDEETPPRREVVEEEEDDASAGNNSSDGEDEEEEEDDDDDEEEDADPAVQRWFHKVEVLLRHVNVTSKRICRHPGSFLSIDEMMKKYKGRSNQTHKMKNKPIKEGYKFFAICCSQTGFVFDFFVDGRQDDRANIVENTVLKLVDSIPMRDTKRYYLAMDNWFTTPRVMEGTRERNVGVIGTARGRPGKAEPFPPTEMKAITDKRFNSLYLMHHPKNFLVARWYDNKDVLLVSTVHKGDETILKNRRRPRVTQANRGHVDRVWANNAYIIPINIPTMIDDYNHWMGGVDRADQLIAYYRPNLRCQRTWMPIFLHCLDIIRINAFIIAKKANNNLDHKDFVAAWIDRLNKMADVSDFQVTRRTVVHKTPSPPQEGGNRRQKKRRRMSHTAPQLPDCRFNGTKAEHLVVMAKSGQNICIYCSYLFQKAKIDGVHPDVLPPRRKVRRSCLACQVALCIDHFDVFHGWDDDEANPPVNKPDETESEEEEPFNEETETV